MVHVYIGGGPIKWVSERVKTIEHKSVQKKLEEYVIWWFHKGQKHMNE